MLLTVETMSETIEVPSLNVYTLSTPAVCSESIRIFPKRGLVVVEIQPRISYLS